VFALANPVNFVDPYGTWGVWFGDVHLGDANPYLIYDRHSWITSGKGVAAWADGFIPVPFWKPFLDVYSDECGNPDPDYAKYRLVGAGSFAAATYGLGGIFAAATTGAKGLRAATFGRTILKPGTLISTLGPGMIPDAMVRVGASSASFIGIFGQIDGLAEIIQFARMASGP
jgi:hypothetical protein